MNRSFILFNLREALEELQSTIAKLETTPDYDSEEYVVAMSHLYHHINTAWNARDTTEKEAYECSEKDFWMWRKFPDYSELFLEEGT